MDLEAEVLVEAEAEEVGKEMVNWRLRIANFKYPTVEGAGEKYHD